MPTYRIWHGECQTYDEAVEVTVVSVEEAAKGILFVYYTGDCDHGASAIKQVPGDRWIATREGSPDYFFIELQDKGNQ